MRTEMIALMNRELREMGRSLPGVEERVKLRRPGPGARMQKDWLLVGTWSWRIMVYTGRRGEVVLHRQTKRSILS